MVEFRGSYFNGSNLHIYHAPVDHINFIEVGDGMKRLYVIHSMAFVPKGLEELSPYPLKGYVSAECPYEALFMFEIHMTNMMNVESYLDPMIELLDHENFDPETHAVGDVRDAMLLNLVVVKIDSCVEEKRELACA